MLFHQNLVCCLLVLIRFSKINGSDMKSLRGEMPRCGTRPSDLQNELSFSSKVKLRTAVLAHCRAASFDPYTQVCCGERIQTGRACCLNFGYDPSNQVCCSGKVHVGLACCRSTVYDPTSQVCCNYQVKLGRACCGSSTYDPTSQVCCNGIVSVGRACCGIVCLRTRRSFIVLSLKMLKVLQRSILPLKFAV